MSECNHTECVTQRTRHGLTGCREDGAGLRNQKTTLSGGRALVDGAPLDRANPSAGYELIAPATDAGGRHWPAGTRYQPSRAGLSVGREYQDIQVIGHGLVRFWGQRV